MTNAAPEHVAETITSSADRTIESSTDASIAEASTTGASTTESTAESVIAPAAETSSPPVASVSESAPSAWAWLTVERLFYGLALLIGFGLRAGALALQPLYTSEAAAAWTAWLSAMGLTPPPAVAEGLSTVFAPTSPLLYSLQSLFFWLAGGGDVVARTPALLAGTVMVLLPWWLRAHLGRGVALLLAFLIAVDPWLVAYSRLADGTAISACLGLLTLIGLMHLLVPVRREIAEGVTGETPVEETQSWLWTAAISGGLLMVSGVHAWNFVPVLLLFWGLVGRGTSVDLNTDLLERVESTATNSQVETSIAGRTNLLDGNQLWALLVFAGAAIFGATGWLARPEGLSYISTSMTGWVNQFVAAESLYSPGWVGLRLLVDQPLVLPFGLAGLLYLWLGRNVPASRMLSHWALFLSLWALWGLVLLAVPGRTPLSLLMLGVPLLFAAAHAVDGILRHFHMEVLWRELFVLYSALTILVISGLFWAAAVVSRAQLDVALARISIVLIVLAALLVLLFALWINTRQALLAAAFFAGCLTVFSALSSTWQLNLEWDRLQPDGFFVEVTDPDVRNLASNIATLSAQRVGDPDQLPLFVEVNGVPDPVLGWYLRDMRSLTWTPALTVDADLPPNALLLSRQGALNSQISANYMGDAYAVRTAWLPTGWLETPAADPNVAEDTNPWIAQWPTRIQPLLRWFFYREIKQLPTSEQVILWAQPS